MKKSIRRSAMAFLKKTILDTKRSWVDVHANLPSMMTTAGWLVGSGLIFQKTTWDELSLYWQRVDEGFDNDAQKKKVIRYGQTSVMAWLIAVAFLWAYHIVSVSIAFLISLINSSDALILFLPTVLLFILKTFAGIVVFITGLIICCVIGVLINVALALIRSRINFYVALTVGLLNMALLFLTHYTVPIFNAQGSFLPEVMREAYLHVILSSETLISGIVGLFSVIGIGSIHIQFLKADGMFKLFQMSLRQKGSNSDLLRE